MTSEQRHQNVEREVSADVVEDVDPGPGSPVIWKELVEDSLPGFKKPFTTKQVDNDKVRRGLAWAHVAVLLVIVGVGAFGWFRGEDLGVWTSFTAPVFTLIGVVIAFYFGKTSD